MSLPFFKKFYLNVVGTQQRYFAIDKVFLPIRFFCRVVLCKQRLNPVNLHYRLTEIVYLLPYWYISKLIKTVWELNLLVRLNIGGTIFMSVLLWAYIFVGCVVVTKDVDAALSYFYSFDHTYLFAIKSELTNICNCVHFDIFTAWKPLQTVLVIIL